MIRTVPILILLLFGGAVIAEEAPAKRKTGTSQRAESGKKPVKKKPASKSDAGTKTQSTPEPPSDRNLTPPKDPPDTGDSPNEGPSGRKASGYGKPATLAADALKEFDGLPEDRRKLIATALATAADNPWLPYKFGGSAPSDGGFDCSGAMYFVLRKTELKPPRTSADQFLWLKEEGRLVEVPATSRSLDDPVFDKLRPGDLLFWGGTYTPSDGRSVNITHVALYLGHEKKDNNTVMINATDGRSYRGTRANGFGVYDFRLPRDGNRSIFMGYGTPPGIAP